MTKVVSKEILVTNNHMDLATFANDDNIQAIVLRGFFTESAKIVSSQMSSKKIALVTQSFRQANQTGKIPDTMGFSQKENEYAHIALNLKEMLDYTAKIYTQKHGLSEPRSAYNTHIHPSAGLASWNQGIMEASTVLMGEYMWFSNYDVTPEVGDLVIAKGFETIEQGNDRDDLARYATNPQSSKKTSMGISVLAIPNREI